MSKYERNMITPGQKFYLDHLLKDLGYRNHKEQTAYLEAHGVMLDRLSEARAHALLNELEEVRVVERKTTRSRLRQLIYDED